jgi:uncharacterized protein
VIRPLILLLALAGALFASPVAAAPTSAAPPFDSGKLKLSFDGYLADGAGIFSPAFIAEMKQRLARIHQQGEITVVFVTVPAIGTADTGGIAKAIGQAMEAKKQAHSDWAVFLLAPVDREFSIALASSDEAATQALKSMDDLNRKQVLQDVGEAFSGAITPFFKIDDWEGGMRAGLDALEVRLDQKRSSPPQPEAAPPDESAA